MHTLKDQLSRPACGARSYTSIPQANATLQKLAVESLAAYASTTRYFLVLAPEAIHTDTLKLCNQATYNKRGWVRDRASRTATQQHY